MFIEKVQVSCPFFICVWNKMTVSVCLGETATPDVIMVWSHVRDPRVGSQEMWQPSRQVLQMCYVGNLVTISVAFSDVRFLKW